MFAHIVPQVYQKAWHSENGKRNVYYFDKHNIEHPIDARGGNISKYFGAIDEYFITEEDKSNGLENDVEAIEDFLAHGIEKQWDMVVRSNIFEWLNSIERYNGKLIGIKADDLKNTPFERDLLDYIILQQLRIFENFIEFDNGNINILLKEIFLYLRQTNKIPAGYNFEEILNNNGFKRTVWKSILIDCKDNEESFLVKLRRVFEEEYNLTFAYLKSEIKARFILSDNPVIWNCSVQKKYKKLESGIFFPITPNCLVMFLDYNNLQLKRGDAVCVFPNERFVKYINSCLRNQSREYIGFMRQNVKEHVCEEFNKEIDWDTMFT